MNLIIRIEGGENTKLTPELIKQFNSLEKEIFSDYIIDSNLPTPEAAPIEGGVPNIERDEKTHSYYTVVEYDVKERLKPEAEIELIDLY